MGLQHKYDESALQTFMRAVKNVKLYLELKPTQFSLVLVQ